MIFWESDDHILRILSIIQANRDQNFPPTGMVCRGVGRNLFRRGTKGVPSVPSRDHTRSEPWMGSRGEAPRNPINVLKIRFSVTNSALFREKNFSIGNLGGDISPLPLPCASDGLKKFRPALVLSWTMSGVGTESPERGVGAGRHEAPERRLVEFEFINCILKYALTYSANFTLCGKAVNSANLVNISATISEI